MINFAELKLKLCEKKFTDIYLQRESDEKIISELLDVIEMQNIFIEKRNAELSHMITKHGHGSNMTCDDHYVLSEIESKLKQVIKGE